ncbi:MAG: hypothetical protein RIT81_00330 [Deltaproteobacteria bacterium]
MATRRELADALWVAFLWLSVAALLGCVALLWLVAPTKNGGARNWIEAVGFLIVFAGAIWTVIIVVLIPALAGVLVAGDAVATLVSNGPVERTPGLLSLVEGGALSFATGSHTTSGTPKAGHSSGTASPPATSRRGGRA